jgi:AcrR family transcriptional regulator
LDAAEKLMRDGGYPAVTTRRLASEAGVSNQLVHYYFRTMDELFLSMMRRNADINLRRLLQALASEQPLRALWKLNSDPEAARLAVEFIALANHRKVINEEAARHAEQMRSLETDVLARILRGRGIDPSVLPPVSLSVLMASIPRAMVMEEAMGVSMGHTETQALVERYLGMLCGESKTGSRKRRRPPPRPHRPGTRNKKR